MESQKTLGDMILIYTNKRLLWVKQETLADTTNSISSKASF